MYFRINGALIWARGANFVPMDQFEGRLTDESHRNLVQSAATSNMNMIRIWGGGSIPPDSFYDACDEAGIMIFHDMMFVEEQYHGPQVNNLEEIEIRHIVRSLSPHPSIIVWVGCNEVSLWTFMGNFKISFLIQNHFCYVPSALSKWVQIVRFMLHLS